MKQQEVWNKLAEPWSKYRKKAPSEVEEFLRGKKGKILDLGCGSGRNIIPGEGKEYYGVDFSEKMLGLAEREAGKKKVKVMFFKESAEKLPFNDNFFDAAVFISALHCIPGEKNREKALKELFRVMKRGSEAMITVWNKGANEKFKNIKANEAFVTWPKLGILYERYYYFYDKEELENLIKKVGFKILDKKYLKEKHSKKNIIFYIKK